MQRVHDALVCVQEEVFAYRGGVNKFLMDDKGSTLLACFGLSSPGARVDDAPRATLAALAVCARLFAMGFAAESLRRLSLPGAAGQLASAVSALDAFVARSSRPPSARPSFRAARGSPADHMAH